MQRRLERAAQLRFNRGVQFSVRAKSCQRRRTGTGWCVCVHPQFYGAFPGEGGLMHAAQCFDVFPAVRFGLCGAICFLCNL